MSYTSISFYLLPLLYVSTPAITMTGCNSSVNIYTAKYQRNVTNIPSIGTPLTSHEISGSGTPSTSQLNCADSSSDVLTSSGGLPSFQYGGAGKPNNEHVCAVSLVISLKLPRLETVLRHLVSQSPCPSLDLKRLSLDSIIHNICFSSTNKKTTKSHKK